MKDKAEAAEKIEHVANIRPVLMYVLKRKERQVAEATLAKDWEVDVSENQKKARDSTAGREEELRK